MPQFEQEAFFSSLLTIFFTFMIFMLILITQFFATINFFVISSSSISMETSKSCTYLVFRSFEVIERLVIVEPILGFMRQQSIVMPISSFLCLFGFAAAFLACGCAMHEDEIKEKVTDMRNSAWRRFRNRRCAHKQRYDRKRRRQTRASRIKNRACFRKSKLEFLKI